MHNMNLLRLILARFWAWYVLWGVLGCSGELWGALGWSGDAVGRSGEIWGALGNSGEL